MNKIVVVIEASLLQQVQNYLEDRSAGNAGLWDEIERILNLPEPEGMDPDCRDGKHGSCVGCPGCPHHEILGDRPSGLQEGEAWDERLEALKDLLRPV